MAEKYVGGFVHTPDTQDPLCIEASTTPDAVRRGGVAFVRDESSQVIAAAAFRPYEVGGQDLGIARVVSLVTSEDADPEAINALLAKTEGVTALTENGMLLDIEIPPEVLEIIKSYETAGEAVERDAIRISLPALWRAAVERRYMRMGDRFVKMQPGYKFPKVA